MVLVLNRSFMAIQVTNLSTAIKRVYTGDAAVVCEKDLVDQQDQHIASMYQTFDFESWAEISQQLPYQRRNFIHGVKVFLRHPSVIQLTRCNKLPKHEVCFSRQNIRVRDEHKCQYCGFQAGTGVAMTLDHVIPRSKGGGTTWDNVVLACSKCNQLKADRTPKEAGMKLLKQPKKPHWHVVGFANKYKKVYRVDWEPFLSYLDAENDNNSEDLYE